VDVEARTRAHPQLHSQRSRRGRCCGLERGGGVGKHLFGQVGVIHGARYGQRADERAEGEDGVAFSVVGVVAVDLGGVILDQRLVAGLSTRFGGGDRTGAPSLLDFNELVGLF
jgi:hypothetical protein